MSYAINSFDTLLFSETMREAGMQEKTAKVLAEELKKLREESFSSAKEEVSVAKATIDRDTISFREEVRQEFKLVRQEIKNAILTTVISLGSIVAICSGVVIAFLK